jgi:hypothetical protein
MNISKTNYKSYVDHNGGRVLLLFLLFLLAIYEFATAGFSAFAIVCLLPVVALFIIAAIRYRMFAFWVLILVNYLIQMKDLPLPIPMSLPNELLEITLLALAIIDVKELKAERAGNIMLYMLLIWCGFVILEVMNDTCNIGINFEAWYTGARAMAFQIMYVFLVFSLYMTNPQILSKYLLIWGCLALFACLWVYKQQTFGFTEAENVWLQTRGSKTHILNAGTLIRYFSIYSDAANFGIGMAATSVAFLIFAITCRINKYRLFYLAVGLACFWAMFPSGTRTAIFCFFAGVIVYIFLSKSIKIAVPVTILFAAFVFILVFTNIGNSYQQIRRMRTAFDKNDASAGQRSVNQQAMKKYMAEAPWGIGIGLGREDVPANNKYRAMAEVPPDSEYVNIWLRTGIIGITVFLITMVFMFAGACWVVLFKLKSPSLRGIGAGMCCAFVAIQLGGYGNQVLMQFPNCLVFYGGLTLVYGLPFYEKEWIAYEEGLFAKQEERKRLKLEKKKASRV